MMLSDHFSLAEATVSETADRFGIDNSAPDILIPILQTVAVKLEKVRYVLGERSTHVNSWYRCPPLNNAVGSHPGSQHLLGEAVDFICPTFGTPLATCKRIIENKSLIDYDQLILEHSWVHISWALRTRKPRGQVLSLLEHGNYANGLTDKKGNNLE
jgi:hypothetical protein